MRVLYRLSVKFTVSTGCRFSFDDYSSASATVDSGEVPGASPDTFPKGSTVRLNLGSFYPGFEVHGAEIQVANGQTHLLVSASYEARAHVKVRLKERLSTFQRRARKAIAEEFEAFRPHGFKLR